LSSCGYLNSDAVDTLEETEGVIVYVAVEQSAPGVALDELLGKAGPDEEPAPDASTMERLRCRMRTAEGRKKHRLSKHTVEPVFGIIKEVMGFRRFHLRGHPKVAIERDLVCLAYNMKRCFKLNDGAALPKIGWPAACAR
jgi:hypothetical protein